MVQILLFLGSKKFRSHHSENASDKTAHTTA
jgi:hypothetical protein